MRFKFEYELNRAWILDDEGEIIGETNYVVPASWINTIYASTYADQYESINEFLDAYQPEVEGEYIYQMAVRDGVLIVD
jgi:hypothetical protein